jgi:hypothetical protein
MLNTPPRIPERHPAINPLTKVGLIFILFFTNINTGSRDQNRAQDGFQRLVRLADRINDRDSRKTKYPISGEIIN